MTISLSQDDYWSLVCSSELSVPPLDSFDVIWQYPEALGQGYFRETYLRDGLELAIADYQSHDDIITESCDRNHPLEYTFDLSPQNHNLSEAPSYAFFGSGMACNERRQQIAHQPIRWVSVHIEPVVFESYAGTPNDPIPPTLQHLIRDPNQEFYGRSGQATAAMQIILQQICQCPYQGFTKRLFLESKVWELMALILEQELEYQQEKPLVAKLKPDDVDRLHQAKAILQQNLDQPPSLAQLARQVGLNECTLKQGFRRVFDTTVFGYVRQCRMERARLLLMQGQMSVHEAAQAVGYASQSRFANAFRKAFGVNPKTFSSQPWH
ncbi:helix-turn-helix transcriptional regulator [Leptothermofonsia sichuanensis E412]|uniref:helix-turn-helix transcriptional regulator n=1 Tax=Leptothermofonsia sichuanensis TaxID=2917832 RepID=UPI001CA6F2E1|nr:AraC family transcriptional regulator [Leptothermofonsia sichuanensis]QZZ21393.1 helix-turn-helix transcriptional regulator [Leptothermofonsia sichuanensis E412]